MRRSRVAGLAAVVLLLVLAAAYTAFWFVAAGRVEPALVEWVQAQREHNLDLSWQAMRVGGFPFAFRIELREARLRDTAGVAGTLQVPLLAGETRPWNFRVWELEVSDGLTASAGPQDAPTVKLTARRAVGSVAISDNSGAAIWLRLTEAATDLPLRLAARQADLWLNLPPHPPQNHTERALGLALDVQGLNLPQVPPPFRNPLDEVAFGATLMGAVPAGPPRQAAAAWRDDGGTLELDQLTLRWGGLAITGSGTLALDNELQPITPTPPAGPRASALSSHVGIARLALGMLAKPGPDGRPQIATSFTIKNGEMFLGPIKLGKAPRIPWQ